MSQIPQRKTLPTSPQRMTTHIVNVDQWGGAANDDSAQCFLKTTLQTMVRDNSRELHIEQEADFCRVRVRINGRLSEQRVHIPELANELLLAVGQDKLENQSDHTGNDNFGKLRVSAQIDGEKRELIVCHYRTASGKSVTLSVNTASAIPEILDQTRLDSPSKRLIRQLYQQRGDTGITLICSQSQDLLRSLFYALLGEINNVEHKIVSFQHTIDKRVPRVSQIQTGDIYRDCGPRDHQTLLDSTTSHSNHIFLDWLNTHDQRMVRALQETPLPTTPITLFWQGPAANGLLDLFSSADSLRKQPNTIIEMSSAELICPHCAEPYIPGKFDFGQLPVTASGTQPEALLFANGCGRCGETGVASLQTITSITHSTDAIREATLNRSLQATRRAVADAQGTRCIAQQIEVLAKTGKINFEDWVKQQ